MVTQVSQFITENVDESSRGIECLMKSMIGLFPTGGPLVERSDGAMVGIISLIALEDPGLEKVTLQAFARVHSYFDWIEEVTGLEMPVCDK